MAGLNKKEFAKKDMNFFSEFTKSSQAFAKAAGIIVIVSIAVVAAVVLFCVFRGITYGVLNKAVKEYDEKFQSPEYVNAKIEAEALAEKSANINRYGFVMQTMEAEAQKDSGVKFSTVDYLKENIPSNIILTSYEIDKDIVNITGEATTKYAATELINLLKENTIFTNDNMTIERVNPKDIGAAEEMVTNYINAKYSFSFTGTLVSKNAVSISYLTNSTTLIKDLDTQWVTTGGTCVIEDIAYVQVGETVYELSSIYVNGSAVSNDELAAAKTVSDTYPNGAFKTFIASDTQIELHYVDTSTLTQEAE